MTAWSAPAEPRQRRVLMVLYFFPPLGGVGMSRNLRNTTNLPRCGWRPVVLTPRNAAYPIQDPATLALVDEATTVIRTRSIEAGHLRAGLIGLLGTIRSVRRSPSAPGRERPPSTPAGPGDVPTSTGEGSAGPLKVGRLRGLRQLFFPDDQIGWLPFAVIAGVRANRTQRLDAMFSTSSPVTAHLIAAVVKSRTGLPWVAEFRDPWIGNVLARRNPWFLRQLQGKLEAWIVRTADEIVCVTPSLTQMYQARYPSARVTTVSNGYDRTETVRRSVNRAPGARFRIVFTGTLDRPTELETFLTGLDRLVVRRPELVDRLEVRFYGLVSDECRRVAGQIIMGRSLERVVTFAGFVTRAEAGAAVASADAALVLLGAGPGMGLFVGGKLYDYIGQNQQILAMVPHGDAREVLEGLEWGVVADPDPASVEDAIRRLIELPPPEGPADPDGRYDRAALAGQLAGCLDRVASAHGAGDQRKGHAR